MDIENFIAEFKKTFVYDLLSMTLKDEQLFEHMVDGDAVLWFKEQTRQMWLMWEKAKAQAVPNAQQALHDRLLVKSIREHVESHISEISVNVFFGTTLEDSFISFENETVDSFLAKIEVA